MKVLTIRQPYASLICNKIKTVEIRSWKTNFRGEFYIHAAVGKDLKIIKSYNNIIKEDNHLFGYIIGKCNLVDCVYLDEEYIINYNKKNKDLGYTISKDCIGYYGFVLDNIEKLEIPIKAVGKLSFWNYDN